MGGTTKVSSPDDNAAAKRFGEDQNVINPGSGVPPDMVRVHLTGHGIAKFDFYSVSGFVGMSALGQQLEHTLQFFFTGEVHLDAAPLALAEDAHTGTKGEF